ncbi:MAG TPA: PIN domain-containing protein [Bryobacteraceae bacterium]|jgi:predicted nucleic acid-binding protein|nr:PIN domain-containing protein [Bryobacteraceae bacterium]
MIDAFFDSNVLLYAHDQRDPVKQQGALRLWGEHSEDGSAHISTQVMQEFYSVATRKLGLSRTTARSVVEGFHAMNIVTIEFSHVLRAIEFERRFQVAFWDGLILAAAEACAAEVLYSEDFTHDRKYGTVRVVNPFAARP